jgi:hypothetical protein
MQSPERLASPSQVPLFPMQAAFDVKIGNWEWRYGA